MAIFYTDTGSLGILQVSSSAQVSGSGSTILTVSGNSGGILAVGDYNQGDNIFEIVSASVNLFVVDANKNVSIANNLIVTGSITGSIASSSFATTASYAARADQVNGFDGAVLIYTGSQNVTQGITGSLRITGSFVVTGSTALSGALAVVGAITSPTIDSLSNSISVISQKLSVDGAALSVRIDTVSNNVSVLSQAVSVANAALSVRVDTVSNAVSAVSQRLSVLSQAVSVADAALSVRIDTVSNNVSILSQAVSVANAALSVRIDTVSNEVSIVESVINNVSAVAPGAVVETGLQNAINALSNRISAIPGGGSVNPTSYVSVANTLNTAALTGISGLTTSVSAGVIYHIEGAIMYSVSAATGNAFGMVWPTANRVAGQWIGGISVNQTGASTFSTLNIGDFDTGDSNSAIWSALVGITGLHFIRVNGIIDAQTGGAIYPVARSSVATNTLVIARGSFFRVARIN